ncbi:hypothetical protein JMUB7528_28540 [Staphylococcus aureus]
MCIRDSNISNVKVLADMKIMDAADYEVSQAIKFGADVITILGVAAVSYTHLRAHETCADLVCRLLLEKKQQKSMT